METKDAQGKTIRAWVSPKLTPANYDAILLDPLVFYPEPRPSEQVSAADAATNARLLQRHI